MILRCLFGCLFWFIWLVGLVWYGCFSMLFCLFMYICFNCCFRVVVVIWGLHWQLICVLLFRCLCLGVFDCMRFGQLFVLCWFILVCYCCLRGWCLDWIVVLLLILIDFLVVDFVVFSLFVWVVTGRLLLAGCMGIIGC